MSVQNLRVIANALAALVGAVMLVPAAYSLLTGRISLFVREHNGCVP